MAAYIMFVASLAGASALIFAARSGEARTLDAGAGTSELDVGRVTVAVAEQPEGSRADCKGRSDVEMYWWGGKIYLNECHTQSLIKLMNSGGEAASICTAITGFLGELPVALGCGVVGGVAKIGAHVLDAIDALGGNSGIIINYPLIGPATAEHQ